MAISRDEFESAMTYDQWKAAWTRNHERFAAQEQAYKPDRADVEALKKLPKPVNVLAIVEDWCGDVVANVPIIERLAKESGKLNVRYAQRLAYAPWPSYDPSLVLTDIVTVAVQVNGKLRATLDLPRGAGREAAEAAALADERVRKHLGDAAPKQAIYVPDRLLNLVAAK